MQLTSIAVYPVKSLGGVFPAEAAVEPWGLAGDRRWLVLNPDGSVLTARTAARMLAVQAEARPDGTLVLRGPDGGELVVKAPLDGPVTPIALSRLESVRLADPTVHDWLSAHLNLPVRLGWLDDPRRRSVSPGHGGRPGDALNLSDAGPLLLATAESMAQLNAWIAAGAAERGEPEPAPLPITRFRPTLVVDGVDEPFAEDGWRTVTIGDVRFRFAERCDRCALTLIDTATLRSGPEPIRTLARHRRADGKTWFGVRLVPLTTGTIRLGDRVIADEY